MNVFTEPPNKQWRKNIHVMEELQQEKQFQQITEIHSKRIDHTLAKIRSFWNKLFFMERKNSSKTKTSRGRTVFQEAKIEKFPRPGIKTIVF